MLNHTLFDSSAIITKRVFCIIASVQEIPFVAQSIGTANVKHTHDLVHAISMDIVSGDGGGGGGSKVCITEARKAEAREVRGTEKGYKRNNQLKSRSIVLNIDFFSVLASALFPFFCMPFVQ